MKIRREFDVVEEIKDFKGPIAVGGHSTIVIALDSGEGRTIRIDEDLLRAILRNAVPGVDYEVENDLGELSEFWSVPLLRESSEYLVNATMASSGKVLDWIATQRDSPLYRKNKESDETFRLRIIKSWRPGHQK